ncbi:unnamed protein product [Closterium sp. NIES-64]|nr:unnamed protein product [Closterium sp. NIES-64]
MAKIFSHLSVADRCSVSLVCRLWFRYERLLPHYMQSEVSAAELRFVLRRFPLIRTLRIRFFGPTVLPGAPREQRAEDRHHKRPGGGRVRAGGVTGAGDGGTESAGVGRAGGGGTAATVTRGGGTQHQPQAAAAPASPAPVPAFPISDADVLDGSAIVRLLSLNTPCRFSRLPARRWNTSPSVLRRVRGSQGLRTYMCDTITAWGRSIRHIEMHDPMPLADEFWKCVEGHPMLSKVTVYKCTHLTDRFLRHVARCGALKELSIASCPNVSGGGFAELAEKCTGLEELVLEDLSLSVVAKKARRAPGTGRARGRGAGEGAGRGEGEGRAEGSVGEDVRVGEGGGEAERGAGGMEGGDGAVRVRGEVEAAEAQAGAEGTAAATASTGRGGSLATSFLNLSSLKLINCALDAHWLEMFAGQLPALRRLTVMACPDPLDRFFLTAARTAARLESVEIVDCEGSHMVQSDRVQSHRLQSHVLPLLQLGWSGLERLQLEGLDGLSDSFLLLAAATCPRLSTLAVEYCRPPHSHHRLAVPTTLHSLPPRL